MSDKKQGVRIVTRKADFHVTVSEHGTISHPRTISHPILLLPKHRKKTITDLTLTVEDVMGPIDVEGLELYMSPGYYVDLYLEFAGFCLSRRIFISEEIISDSNSKKEICWDHEKIIGEAKNIIIQLVRDYLNDLKSENGVKT